MVIIKLKSRIIMVIIDFHYTVSVQQLNRMKTLCTLIRICIHGG